jgi:hypothetical protein
MQTTNFNFFSIFKSPHFMTPETSLILATACQFSQAHIYKQISIISGKIKKIIGKSVLGN